MPWGGFGEGRKRIGINPAILSHGGPQSAPPPSDPGPPKGWAEGVKKVPPPIIAKHLSLHPGAGLPLSPARCPREPSAAFLLDCTTSKGKVPNRFPMRVKVFTADDHPIFRRGLCDIIGEEEDLQLVGQASSGDEALEKILASPPDVAILDIDMPHMTGLEAARILSGRNLPTRIILLTMHEDEALFNEAVDLGVLGYVLKENAVDDLVRAVRTVAEGGTFISPSVSDFVLRRGRKTRTLRATNAGLEKLTPAEKRILRQIADDRTSKEIASALGISVRTVETHRQNISTKLGLRGSHSLLKFAFHNKSHL